ncbi:MAG: toprim domain-containing protein, partial [Anaerolineae bacterium]|nr:toprim domain-containing protein [Anaerolineae bacterium]
MEAYCVRCKTQREMIAATPVFTAKGAPATRGTCPICGATLFRMGATPAHEGLKPPAETQTAERPNVSTSKRSTRTTAVKSKTGRWSGKKEEEGDGKAPRSTYQGPRKGKLVIVESPAKARTVGNYLGREYTVRASVGHVRDLYKSKLSVDIEHDFRPIYTVPKEKKKVVAELTEAVARAEEVYLATDPDREGEAIAWHVAETTGLEPERTRRVVFHEITRQAVAEAFAHARGIYQNMVNSQQTPRILERVVGYQIS